MNAEELTERWETQEFFISKIQEYYPNEQKPTLEESLDISLNGAMAINLMQEYAEAYHKAKVKELLPSEGKILKGAIQQFTMQDQAMWGEGANWCKDYITKKLKHSQS